ncbi:hypothetical protein BURK2_01080 [Burkholderiales bacterium]|nr:hypothetical protein BURK2_01080 [Burkholderiales bacterium]
MSYRPTLYVSLALVAALSFAAAYYLDVSELVRTVAALPFVGALFAALFQVLRDHSSFERDRIKQEREHAFLVASTSHMSSVAFDKHVEFCEAYIKALQALLGKLFAEGPTEKAWEYLKPLYDVRRTYRLWVSSSMAQQLDEFEKRVGEIAAALSQWKSASDYKLGQIHHLDKAHKLFAEVMDMEKADRNGPDADSKKAQGYTLVFEHLQSILGIETLTNLRDKVLRDALERE